MATWTGIVDLETLTPDVTTDGVVITQVNPMQAGNGTVNTTLRLGDPLTGKNRVLRMNNQITTTVNPNGTPCLDFADTLIIKTTGSTCFDRVTAGTTPLIRFRRVAMSYVAGGGFLFMGNDNRVQSIFEDVTITFDSYGFGFFGREAIWNNVVIRGNAGGDTFPPNLPLEINNLKLYDHTTMKLEHGSGGIYSVQMLNSAGVSSLNGFFYSGFGASTVSDQTDRCMWLLDSPLDATKCSMTNNGAIGTLRTFRASYKTGSGAGISGARLYTAYQSGSNWIDYRLTRTRNTSVTAASAYFTQPTTDQDPAIGAQTLRWMYILRPGDRVRISGFVNAANNRDATIVGQLNSTTGRFYATADRLLIDTASTLVGEGTRSATITRLEPVSDSSGNFVDTMLEIGFARSLNSQGGNSFSSTFTLANYQSGAQTGVAGQTFLRESWETYLIPPYPYRRESQQWTIPQSAPSLGARVEWNPLAVNDPLITVTNSATVLAYTLLDTPQKAYDYKEAWKRIDPNTLVGGVRENFFTRSGSTLDFGNWNVVIDATATVPMAVNTGSRTITLDAVNFVGNITTTGTVTLANGATLNGSYTDASGTRVIIRTSDNLALSTYLTINGTPQAWQTGQTARSIFVTPSSVVRIYAHAYGYQPRIINITGNAASDYIISLVPETIVDTSLSSTTRDTIASALAVGVDGSSRIFLSVNTDLSQYRPEEVLNALHYFTVTQGATIAAAAVAANTVAGFALILGGFIIRSPGFYGKVADSVTTVGPKGIYVPLYVDVDPSVYVAMPTYSPVEKNTSGIVLGTALWTQQTAVISALDKSDIRNGLATQTSLTVVNNGVKKASLLVPHTDNL